MSATVKLSSKLAGDYEINGVDQIAGDLIAEPKALRVAVIWFDVRTIAEDVATGDHIPTIQIRRIEPLGASDVVSEKIKEEVNAAIQKRTGRTPIPWDIVEVTEGHDPDQMTIDE